MNYTVREKVRSERAKAIIQVWASMLLPFQGANPNVHRPRALPWAECLLAFQAVTPRLVYRTPIIYDVSTFATFASLRAKIEGRPAGMCGLTQRRKEVRCKKYRPYVFLFCSAHLKTKKLLASKLTRSWNFVPRPAFEIIKVGKMWVKRKMQKNTAI